MKKTVFFISLLFMGLFVPQCVFGWGVVTHAYFADELGKHYGVENLPAMVYGATAPDMFNQMYRLEYLDYLHTLTHYDFMKIVDNASGIRQYAFAIGFVSHNDSCGADNTAHHNGRTTPGKGYIITKVEILKPVLVSQLTDVVIASGVDENLAQILVEQTAPMLTELFIETAVDILIKRNQNPSIGTLLFQSAEFTDFEIDSLLVKAYAGDLATEYDLSKGAADEIIAGAEKEYPELMKKQGDIFSKSESEAVHLLAVQGAEVSENYLGFKTGKDVTVPPEIIPVYKDFLLDHAIPAVLGDYSAEIDATLDYLAGQMLPLDVAGMPQAAEYSPSRNYPNPFNPATTIEYSIPERCRVKITVYNTIGQVAAVLEDAEKHEGRHIVTWDASGFSSGLYFCRIEAGSFTTAVKMHLIR